MLALRIMNWQL